MRTPFEHAVTRHGAVVLRVCRAVLGPGADAEDAWSETFMAALRAWPELDEGTNTQAWLVRVAQRKCVDLIRARARRAVPRSELPESPSSLGLPGEGHEEIWGLVVALPERQRLAIAYHYLGGLPHAETAEIIGGSSASVRRAAADGVKTLRRRLAEAPEKEDPR